MMTSPRFRDVGASFSDRRGHAHNLSSESGHHITETIGGLYGDDDDYPPSNDHHQRPMSFIASPRGGEQIPHHGSRLADHNIQLGRSQSDTAATYQSLTGENPNGSNASHPSPPSRMPSQRSNSYDSTPISPISPLSPTLREMQEAEQFPLTNIDNPSDIAQELSNLQALRRMSMDVSNHSDPDLLPFQGVSLMAMPSVAPKGDDDADPSRLLWVPAGVHPELAPSEFKTFVETRVKRMKRRSSEASSSSLSPDGLNRSDSGGLRRKKSMLSRQVDSNAVHGGDNYVDGATRLQRSSSQSGPGGLSLDELVNDPTKAVQRLTLESQAADETGDMPILPSVPGTGLRRSTRTTYRKGGSLRRGGGSLRTGGERTSFSSRIAKHSEEGDEDATTEALPNAPPGHGLSRVQSEPINADDFARQNKSVRRQQTFSRDNVAAGMESSGGRPSVSRWDQNADSNIPQIVETPAAEESSSSLDYNTAQQPRAFPERSSSQHVQDQSSAPGEPPARSNRRPAYNQPAPNASQQSQGRNRPSSRENKSLDNMAQTPLPGRENTSTGDLTYIPTFSGSHEESQPERKGSKKDKSDSERSSKSSPWKWLKSDDKDKKKKDEESKKSRSKPSIDKGQDNARLDVLQTSIEGGPREKGRGSLVLDRDNVDSKLEEERKKENGKKSGDNKKEKDGLFASIFGGKKKGEKDTSHRKSRSDRPLSPEPAPYRPLKPDVDYHWTRFPILEERAIYRMAHIKLANPRRALYSQVLLSNFMYAYLAKVQAMHPQMQVPISPQQKRLQEEERRRKEQEQAYLEQQQAQESMDRYNYEYHRANTDQYDQNTQQGDYPEDAEIYDYDHNTHQGHDSGYADGNGYGHQGDGKDYYGYDYQDQGQDNGNGNGNGNGHGDGRHRQGEDEMW